MHLLIREGHLAVPKVFQGVELQFLEAGHMVDYVHLSLLKPGAPPLPFLRIGQEHIQNLEVGIENRLRVVV